MAPLFTEGIIKHQIYVEGTKNTWSFCFKELFMYLCPFLKVVFQSKQFKSVTPIKIFKLKFILIIRAAHGKEINYLRYPRYLAFFLELWYQLKTNINVCKVFPSLNV